jgi:ubiquitin C-terminal hydrolase
MDPRLIQIRRIQQLKYLEQFKNQDTNIGTNYDIGTNSNTNTDIGTNSNIGTNTDIDTNTNTDIGEQIKKRIIDNHNLNNIVINTKGIKGLKNLGNSCYMNSILQVLFNTHEFKDIIIDSDLAKKLYPFVTKNISSENIKNYSLIMEKCISTLTYQLHKLTNIIWSDSATSSVISPNEFKSIFGNKMESFRNYNQQDCHEALNCILDTIHTELEINVNIEYKIFNNDYLKLFDMIDEKKLSDIECCKMEGEYPNIWELYRAKKALESYNKRKYSMITNLFQNLICDTIQCPTCNFHTYIFEPSNIISVSIPNNKFNNEQINEQISKINHFEQMDETRKNTIRELLTSSNKQKQTYSLDECFDKFTNIEVLDDTNKWFCPHCNNKVNAIKTCKIWIPSKILIVHIKRFVHNFNNSNYTANKLNNMVEFPVNNFNIKNYMSDYTKKDIIYDLYAVSNHMGSIDGGHYYSYVKSLEDSKWYNMNDSHVSSIDEKNIINQNAYVLFYKLRE